MSIINILFYSNKCEGSKQLISMLQSEQLLRFFHQFCIDNNPKTPQQIKVTPTVIIRGVPTPYIAGEAFTWLAKVKQWKQNMMLQQIKTAQEKYLQNINNNLATEQSNVLGFNELEMSGMSDIFSFYSKNIATECQDALPQSFFNYNNLGKESIFTPPLENGSYKPVKPTIDNDGIYKINKKQSELVKNLESERKNQDEVFKKNIENFRKQYAN